MKPTIRLLRASGLATALILTIAAATNAAETSRDSDVELAAPGVNVVSTVPYCAVNSVAGDGFGYPGNPIELAARAAATGILVNGGLGDAMNAAWAGKVVLVERGSITFYQIAIVNFCCWVAVEQKRRPGGSPPKANNKTERKVI